jgi:hypothetical protein
MLDMVKAQTEGVQRPPRVLHFTTSNIFGELGWQREEFVFSQRQSYYSNMRTVKALRVQRKALHHPVISVVSTFAIETGVSETAYVQGCDSQLNCSRLIFLCMVR